MCRAGVGAFSDARATGLGLRIGLTGAADVCGRVCRLMSRRGSRDAVDVEDAPLLVARERRGVASM